MFARIIGSDLILDERHDAPPWNCAPAPAARTVPGIPCHDKGIHPIEFRKEYYVLFPEAKGTRHEINNKVPRRFQWITGHEAGLFGCSHGIMDARMTSALIPAFSPEEKEKRLPPISRIKPLDWSNRWAKGRNVCLGKILSRGRG